MKIVFALFLMMSVQMNNAHAGYTCYADLDVVGLSGGGASVRVTNSPLSPEGSSSAFSLPSGAAIRPYDSYVVGSVQFRKYILAPGMGFSLLQRVENTREVKFMLHSASMGPDPIYAKVYLQSGAAAVPGAIVIPNKSRVTLKTSWDKTDGELFYVVDCPKAIIP